MQNDPLGITSQLRETLEEISEPGTVEMIDEAVSKMNRKPTVWQRIRNLPAIYRKRFPSKIIKDLMADKKAHGAHVSYDGHMVKALFLYRTECYDRKAVMRIRFGIWDDALVTQQGGPQCA